MRQLIEMRAQVLHNRGDMSNAMAQSDFKLAAIDLDGTLLGPDLTISPENRRAVRALHERSMEIAIASGRHYQSIRPFLQALPEIRWAVSVQGGEVADRERKLILARHFMERAQVEMAVDEAMRLDFSPVVYGTDGVFTHVSRNDNLAFYEHLSGLTLERLAREELARFPAFKVLWAGEPEQVRSVMAAPPPSREFERVQTHRRIVEFMPMGITKATGLEALAAHLQISARDAVVFGDAANDIPMFKWAGMSVAMAHGWCEAIESAIKTSAVGPPETALARAVEAVLG